jgi:hypothetical protein
MAHIRRKIGLNVNNNEYKIIKAAAERKNLSISDYIAFKLDLKRPKVVLLNDVLKKLPDEANKKFSIPDLFSVKEWKSFSKGSRIAVGKAFYLLVQKSGKQLKIEFLDKTSGNLAVYRKKN